MPPTLQALFRLVLLKCPGTGTLSLRLVVGRNLTSNTTYVAPSHCRGGADTIKLTRDRMNQYQRDIYFSSLPKNFQDAIQATSLLGYKYIWIDSLFIIQDSHED